MVTEKSMHLSKLAIPVHLTYFHNLQPLRDPASLVELGRTGCREIFSDMKVTFIPSEY